MRPPAEHQMPPTKGNKPESKMSPSSHALATATTNSQQSH